MATPAFALAPAGFLRLRGHLAILVLGAAMAVAFGACHDPGPGGSASSGAIVSDPIEIGAIGGQRGTVALHLAAGSEAVYVSLPPGSIPEGVAATISNTATAGSVTATVVEGGFDPVLLNATAGDELILDIVTGGGDTLIFEAKVPATRRPTIVRVNPPPQKRDVPLNTIVVIVFSEPIEAASLTANAVQLLHDGGLVAGHLEFRTPDRVTAAFVPSAPLMTGTEYRLVVTQDIRDLDGESLDTAVTVPFTTVGDYSLDFTVQPAETPAGAAIAPPVRIRVRDPAGSTVTAFTGDISIALGLSPRGDTLRGTRSVAAVAGEATFSDLSINLAATGYTLVATAQDVRPDTSAPFTINSGPAGSVAISPPTLTISVGNVNTLRATVRDPAGAIVDFPTVAWSTSNPAVATVTPDSGGKLGQVAALSPGSVTISATSGSVTGTATVTVDPGPDPGLSILKHPSNSGESQHDTAYATLAGPVRVLVLRDGIPAAGILVNWSLVEGHESQGSVSSPTSVTNAAGEATERLTFGQRSCAAHIVTASIDGAAGSPVRFDPLRPSPGRSVGILATPTGYRYPVSTTLMGEPGASIQWAVTGHDSRGDGTYSVALEWAVSSGGGAITPTSMRTTDESAKQPQDCTGSIGIATHTLGPQLGPQTVTARAPELPGAPAVTFTAFVMTRVVEVQGDAVARFVEDSITVPPGASVGWVWVCNPWDNNQECASHNVTFEDAPGQLASSDTKMNGEHTRTFIAPGTYRYRCTIHSESSRSGMTGMVVVR